MLLAAPFFLTLLLFLLTGWFPANGSGYANGVQHAYTYNAQNRLTNLGVTRGAGVSPVVFRE